MSKMHSLTDVAESLGVSARTVRSWIDSYHRHGRRLRNLRRRQWTRIARVDVGGVSRLLRAGIESRGIRCPRSRGAGNALMTLLSMPVVLDPEHGRLIVTAHGKRHSISCGADPITQRAVVSDDAEDVGETVGTQIAIRWQRHGDEGDTLWPFGVLMPRREPRFRNSFRELVAGFALFNSHATFRLDWFSDMTDWPATDIAWRKWMPHQPTSCHWYAQAHFERLIGAHITHDRRRDCHPTRTRPASSTADC